MKAANTTLVRVDYNVAELRDQFSNMTVVNQHLLTGMEESKAQEYQDHVKTVLCPGTSADDTYCRINRDRVPKTGNWIQEQQEFKCWMDNESLKPILWVSGTPGAGKTYIASNIISYLKEIHPQNVRHPSYVSVGYFFFKDNNPQTRSLHQALCNIAFQVAQNSSLYAKHITSCVGSPRDISTLESLWQKLFVKFFIDNNPLDGGLYVVLDAVDECDSEDRQDLFRFLNDVKLGGKLHILMLGRPQIIEEIESLMSIVSIPTIHISESNNSEDIARYIRSRISKSVYLKRASKNLQSEIVLKLSTEAQGMVR